MMQISSTGFPADGPLPRRFSCDGDDLSPPLNWSDVPAGTRSLALIVDDPDAPDPTAPKRVWVHWIRYNLPPHSNGLAEAAGNAPPTNGVLDALSDAGTRGYHGPCPPVGRHRYYFRLFALDCLLPDLGTTARRPDVEAAMAGHVLASAVVMGSYAHPQ